jgi:hypothetical protein
MLWTRKRKSLSASTTETKKARLSTSGPVVESHDSEDEEEIKPVVRNGLVVRLPGTSLSKETSSSVIVIDDSDAELDVLPSPIDIKPDSRWLDGTPSVDGCGDPPRPQQLNTAALAPNPTVGPVNEESSLKPANLAST